MFVSMVGVVAVVILHSDIIVILAMAGGDWAMFRTTCTLYDL